MSFETLDVKPGSILDVSEALLVCMATALVIAGALLSTADLRQGGLPIVVAPEQVVEMDNSMSFVFCLLGSCALMLLYVIFSSCLRFLRWWSVMLGTVRNCRLASLHPIAAATHMSIVS